MTHFAQRRWPAVARVHGCSPGYLLLSLALSVLLTVLVNVLIRPL